MIYWAPFVSSLWFHDVMILISLWFKNIIHTRLCWYYSASILIYISWAFTSFIHIGIYSALIRHLEVGAPYHFTSRTIELFANILLAHYWHFHWLLLTPPKKMPPPLLTHYGKIGATPQECQALPTSCHFIERFRRICARHLARLQSREHATPLGCRPDIDE